MRTRCPLFATLPFLILVACTHARPAEDAKQGAGDDEGTPRALVWRKACAQGEAKACAQIAASVLYADRGDLLMAALGDLEAGCAKGVQDACAAVEIARMKPESLETSVQRISKACAGGSYFACFLELPLSLELAGSEEAKVAMVQEGAAECESEGGVKCTIAAGALRARGRCGPRCLPRRCPLPAGLRVQGSRELLPARDPARGVHRRRAARSGAPGVHHRLRRGDRTGVLQPRLPALRGEGRARRPLAARVHAKRACDLGDRTACDFLARTNEGKTFPPPEGSAAFTSPEEFEHVQRKYCDLGGGEACSDLAFLKGDVIEKSGKLEQMDPILGLLQQGCDAGAVRSCNALGHVVRDAIGACESGESNQCIVAGFAHARGIRLPPMSGESLPANPSQARRRSRRPATAVRPASAIAPRPPRRRDAVEARSSRRRLRRAARGQEHPAGGGIQREAGRAGASRARLKAITGTLHFTRGSLRHARPFPPRSPPPPAPPRLSPHTVVPGRA